MKNFVRCVALAASMFAGAGLVACSGESSSVTMPSQSVQTTESALAADLGGTMIWRPDAGGTGVCTNPKEIASGGSALTLSVKADVTYVDLQVPGQLTKLVGLQVGSDYVAIPPGMVRVHVATVELGNQFANRSAQDVRSCWNS